MGDGTKHGPGGEGMPNEARDKAIAEGLKALGEWIAGFKYESVAASTGLCTSVTLDSLSVVIINSPVLVD